MVGLLTLKDKVIPPVLLPALFVVRITERFLFAIADCFDAIAIYALCFQKTLQRMGAAVS
jgi:hypothetical protein